MLGTADHVIKRPYWTKNLEGQRLLNLQQLARKQLLIV